MRLLKEDSPKVIRPEVKATCAVCLADFAFGPREAGVEVTNEMEYMVDCPSCHRELLVNMYSTVVR